MREDAVALIVLVCGVIILGAGAIMYNSTACYSRWDDSRKSQWGFFSGCRVESAGKMVPESRIWFERNPE